MGEEKDNEQTNEVKSEIQVGAKVTGKDKFQGKVNEYSPVEKGIRPTLKANINGKLGKTYFDLQSDYRGDMKDQHHDLDIDFNRVLKQEFSFDALYHRLDHDPLTNMDVVSHARSGVYVDDFNPNDQYRIERSEFTSQTEIVLPPLPFIKFYVKFHDERRKGEYQARTLSKCSACHMVAKSRAIDNYNRTVQIGSRIGIGRSSIDYSYSHNSFKEREAAPTNDYIKVQHPEKIIPVFNSRIGYGNDETLAFDVIPETEKNTHLVRAAIPVSNTVTVSGQYLNANVENISSDLNWKTNSFAGGISTRIGKKGFFNARFQHLKITNDSIFIDIFEPVDVAGPKVGNTYAGAYGAGTFDFMRLSALSRTVWDFDANFRYRLSKQLKMHLGYELKKIDREFYDIENTTSHTFKGKLTYRPAKRLKLTFDGKYKTVEDPFANVKGGIAPGLQFQAYTNPFVGTQFFQWHGERMVNLTNSPTSLYELKGRFNWSAGAKMSLSGNIQIRNEENDTFDYSGASWNRDVTQYGLDLWFMLGDKFPVSATYYNHDTQYSSIFAIAAIEGCGAGFVGGMTGTLTDMMNYDVENQTILVNFNYLASKTLSMFCNLNYAESAAKINDLALDTSQLDYLPGSGPTALDFDNFGETADYSELDIKQMIGELGFQLALNKSWMVNGSFFYYFYDDLAEYLFTDTTGTNYSFFLGFTWTN
jgi:hypothetical protein